MAWDISDWQRGGILDEYRFVMCDNKNYTEQEELKGVLSARIVGNLDGDVKWSGQIEVSNSNFKTNRAIRVYYKPSVDGRSTLVLLGTFITGNDTKGFSHGRFTGTIDLYSTLQRLEDAKLTRNLTLKKGASAKSAFWSLVQLEGVKGITEVSSAVKDKAFTATEVQEHGKSVLAAARRVAGFLNASLCVSSRGVITLVPYVEPAKRPRSYTVPSGSKSVVFVGLDIKDIQSEVVNRYTVVYMKEEKYKVEDGTYKSNYTDKNGVYHPKGSVKYKTKKRKVPVYGTVQLADSSAYSYKNRGRHVDKVETIQSMKPETPARALEIAKSRLSKIHGGRDWTFDSWYMPYTIGDVIRFAYRDSEQHAGFDIDGLVTDIEYELTPQGMKMRTTVRGLRNN